MIRRALIRVLRRRHHISDDARDVGVLAVQFQPVPLKARRIKELADQAVQFLRLSLDIARDAPGSRLASRPRS